jgi:predicted GNAT family acetyltransferase
MEIAKLTPENIDEFAYPCMMKKSRWIKNPEHYRSISLSHLKKNIDRRINGIVAVESGRAVGHLFYGPLKGAGFPVRCDEEDINAVFCTFMDGKYSGEGIGKKMVEAVVDDLRGTPGLLVLATGLKEYMPIQPFLKLGFRQILDGPFWKIGYHPIEKETVDVETYIPELEWDYVKPFTFITGDFCPFLVHIREEQKTIANKFQDLLPVEEIPFEDAVKQDENVTPGFYIYGKEVPPGILAGSKLKQYIKKTVRDESMKTFGTTTPPKYERRK